MPVLPFLEDKKENILTIVQCSKEAGARFIYPAFGMTMRSGQREWYLDQLEQQFPGHGLKARYQKRYGDRINVQAHTPRNCGMYFLRHVSPMEFCIGCRKLLQLTRGAIGTISFAFFEGFL